jgi:hypothetical protein
MSEDITRPGDPPEESAEPELPEHAIDEAERLTRLARETTGGEAERYRRDRDRQLADYGFTARVRREDAREVLVCHPREWVENGTIHPERVEDLDRAVEVPLSGPGDPPRWEAVDEQNRELVEAVRERHGPVHGDNAAALADFMGNHYAKPMADATGDELREFVEEYFPRNAWPSAEQKASVGRSIELVFEIADEPVPDF